ncbi:MAG: hypothetical protein ACYCX4_00145 [Bacillota bacterium]
MLMLASYLEYRVRDALKNSNQAVRLPGNKTTATPSAILDDIQVVIFQGQRLFPKNISKQALEMVNLSEAADCFCQLI